MFYDDFSGVQYLEGPLEGGWAARARYYAIDALDSDLLRSLQELRLYRKWFILNSTVYYVMSLTGIMDNSLSTTNSLLFKIVGLSSWCCFSALMEQGLNSKNIIKSCPLFELEVHTAHCTLRNAQNNKYFIKVNFFGIINNYLHRCPPVPGSALTVARCC